MPVNTDQVEPFRFRPLGARERERLERQAPKTASPWPPQDRPRAAPTYNMQPAPPMGPWDRLRQGDGGAGPGPQDSGSDARGRWMQPNPSRDWGDNAERTEPVPYRPIPQRGSRPPDIEPPSQQLYPTLNRPNDGPPAERPLIAARLPAR